MPFDTALWWDSAECGGGVRSCIEAGRVSEAERAVDLVVTAVVVCRLDVYVNIMRNMISSHAINTRWRSINYTRTQIHTRINSTIQ